MGQALYPVFSLFCFTEGPQFHELAIIADFAQGETGLEARSAFAMPLSFLGVELVCKHGVCDSGATLCLLHHTTLFLWSHKGVEGMVVPKLQENLDKLEGLGKPQMGGKSWIKMVSVQKSG